MSSFIGRQDEVASSIPHSIQSRTSSGSTSQYAAASDGLFCYPVGRRRRRSRIVATWLCGLALFWPGLNTAADETSAADRGEPEQTEAEETEPVGDTPDVDVEGSIEDAVAGQRWSVSGDLRVAYSYSDQKSRDGSDSDGDPRVGVSCPGS